MADPFSTAMMLGFQASRDAALTGAEREANQFTHDEAKLAYERALEADASKYQRSVADMKAAGLNPMLAASSSGGSVSSTPGSSVGHNPVELGSVLSASLRSAELKLQERALDIQEKKVDSEVKKTDEETFGLKIQNWVNDNTKELKVEGERLANDYAAGKIKLTDAQVSEVIQQTAVLAEQEQTEGVKRGLMMAETALKKASKEQIVQMLPYQKALADAQTSEAKAAAALSWAHEAYQRGLIDDGYLDNFCREMAANASSAESDAAIAGVKAAIQSGDYSHSKVGYVPGISEFATGLSNALGIIGNVFTGIIRR